MESFFTTSTTPILLLFLTTAAAVTVQDLEGALSALRSQGYTLFPNAVATSDLRLLLLSLNSTFTLFSPPDLLVFSLDLSSTATDYVQYLLRHVSPNHLSLADLYSIQGDPYLDTLIPPHRLLIDKSLVIKNGTVSESVLLDGVRVSVPDLFLGSSIAVHGLEGILASQEEEINHSVDPPFVLPVDWFERNPPETSLAVRANSVDPPVVSPVAWFERNPPENSFTVEANAADPPFASPAAWFERNPPETSLTIQANSVDSPFMSPVERFERDSPQTSLSVQANAVDPPFVSPVEWFERNPPETSLTVQAGLSGKLITESRPKKRRESWR